MVSAAGVTLITGYEFHQPSALSHFKPVSAEVRATLYDNAREVLDQVYRHFLTELKPQVNDVTYPDDDLLLRVTTHWAPNGTYFSELTTYDTRHDSTGTNLPDSFDVVVANAPYQPTGATGDNASGDTSASD